jgi:hypothetical protein
MPTSKQKKGRDDSMAEILAKIHDGQRIRLETAKNDLKTKIIPRLEQLGIAAVQATYSGYGDSGSIQTIDYLDATHKPVDIERVAPTITPEVERALDQFLPDGFEINEGGQGDITIEVRKGVVRIEHQENYTQTHDTTEEFTL